MSANQMITQADMDTRLRDWGDGLVRIAKVHADGGDANAVATAFIKDLYAHDMGEVLFKPTLTSEVYFRLDFEGALSYFVAGNAKYPEDGGFGLKPWTAADFDNAGYLPGEESGTVMGNKVLKDSSGATTIANYSMVFRRDSTGKLRIVLHHSSLPYAAAA